MFTKLVYWVTHPAESAKAIITFLALLQPILRGFGVDLAGLDPVLNEAWLTAVLTTAAPILAWLVPNAKKPASPVPPA